MALASCAGSPNGNLSSLPSYTNASRRVLAPRDVTGPAIVIGFYQDADFGHQSGLLTFGGSGSAPLQTLSSATPSELLADPTGGYFVRRNNSSGALVVAAYTAGGSFVRVLTGLAAPGAMAADPAGDLFVIDSGAAVVEFAPTATAPTRTAATGTNLRAIAVDAQSHLYVASYPTAKVPGSITEYAPGSTNVLWRLGLDELNLVTMAVDPNRSLLYLAEGGQVTQTISVYRTGESTPVRVLPARAVYAMAIGPAGNLYVLGSTGNNHGQLNVYGPGAAKHLESFQASSLPPFACGANPGLSIDSQGDAYVADCWGGFHPSGSTAEFSPDGHFIRALNAAQDVPSGVIVLN